LFGTDEQKQRLLPRCASGEWSPAFALSEPDAGSDPGGMITSAVPAGDGGWVLNGTKNWITNLGVADFYIVFAVTDRENRRITAFIVESDRPGFTVGKLERKLGIRGSPTGQPSFADVHVGPENVLGEVGKGLKVALTTLERTRLGAGAQALGLAQGATDYAVAYARERRQFGRAIDEFQAIQFKLAEMELRTAAGRELLYRACAMVDRGEPGAGKYASMAKVFCSDTAMWVTVEAVQVLGGYGYVKEYPVERMMRDAKITQIYEGTNEIQRLVIARTLR
jgi:alkylation response protein AidB-like acyl-CoA dehydrogenase